MLQHGQGTTKAPLVWVQSLMALLLLFCFHAPGSQWRFDSHRSKILRKLQSLRVHPDALHISSFEKCNSVYCIFEGDFDFSHFKAGYSQPSPLLYVGSTAVGVTKRHLNRMAVYRRLFESWLKRHRLPHTLHGKFEAFCDEQWAAHSQALEESGRLTWSQVQGVKSKMHQKFVLYIEDHHPNHVVCYCQLLPSILHEEHSDHMG